MVILNTTNVSENTPTEIRDWLDLIIESMKNPNNPQINRNKPAIVKAARLAELDNLTSEQIADAKEQEMRKATVAMIEDTAKVETEKKVKEDGIINALKLNILDKSQIATIFNVNIEYIEQIETKVK